MMESYGLKIYEPADHEEKHAIMDGFKKMDEQNARNK